MDFIYEFIFGLLFEVFVEGVYGATKNKKIPIVIRLLIATSVCGFLFLLGILFGISALIGSRFWGALFLWIGSLCFIVLWVIWCVKIIQYK